MSRMLYVYRVWFQTEEGERVFKQVSAMNPEVAARRASNMVEEDQYLMNNGGRKRAWEVAFVQDVSPDNSGMIQMIMPDALPPQALTKSNIPRTRKRA